MQDNDEQRELDIHKLTENKDDDLKRKDRQMIMRGMSMLGQFGFTIAICVIIGLFLGRFIDGLLGTSPVFITICSLLGTLAAFKALYDLTKNWNGK